MAQVEAAQTDDKEQVRLAKRPAPKLVSNRGPLAGQAPSVDQIEQKKSLNRIKRLESLLTFESQIREVKTLRELWFCIANEGLHLTSASRIFVLKPSGRKRKKLRMCAVSNLSVLDANSPTVIALEKQISQAMVQAGQRSPEHQSSPYPFNLSYGEDSAGKHNSVLIVLRNGREQLLGAIVVSGNGPELANETPVLKRLGQVSQFAWGAIAPKRAVAPSFGARRVLIWMAAALLIAAMFIRVPLSTLAPVEVVASDPEVISAPISGVIRRVLVEGNTQVSAGTPLFQYEDSVLLAELKIAEQNLSVANAKLKKAQQSSFGNGGGQRDLATAKAELDLALAELNFAQSKFSQTLVKAPKSGVVVLDRKSDWQGKPVSVGQRVLEIAQVENFETRIDLPVSDAIVLRNKAPVKLYLDTNPLNALDAQVTSASYRASLDVSNELSFTVSAKLVDDTEPTLRIGARGTAQIYGDDVSLGFYLFRRPLAAIRQWVGW